MISSATLTTMSLHSSRRAGLTLIEALVVVLVVCLLVFLFMPSLANRNRRSRKTQCLSNLKQVTLSALVWTSDRNSDFPWRVPGARAGTLESAETPQVFRHFAILSNELVTPQILICPTEKRRSASKDFLQLANANLSYFVNVNAASNGPVNPLFGDRNITGGNDAQSFLHTIKSTSGLGWRKELHQHSGNIAFSDGSACSMSTPALQEMVITNTIPLRLAIR